MFDPPQDVRVQPPAGSLSRKTLHLCSSPGRTVAHHIRDGTVMMAGSCCSQRHVINIQPEGKMNVWTTFHHNRLNCCRDIAPKWWTDSNPSPVLFRRRRPPAAVWMMAVVRQKKRRMKFLKSPISSYGAAGSVDRCQVDEFYSFSRAGMAGTYLRYLQGRPKLYDFARNQSSI